MGYTDGKVVREMITLVYLVLSDEHWRLKTADLAYLFQSWQYAVFCLKDSALPTAWIYDHTPKLQPPIPCQSDVRAHGS